MIGRCTRRIDLERREIQDTCDSVTAEFFMIDGGSMSDRDAIARQALSLSPEDRAWVADVLERSLDSEAFATPEIADAWSKEIDRRIAAYDRGDTRAVDFETVLSHVRKALTERRGARKAS
jgi:putative addiction module component (TIGR02574 family)